MANYFYGLLGNFYAPATIESAVLANQNDSLYHTHTKVRHPSYNQFSENARLYEIEI
jgi:hypothetical protein